MPTALAPFNGLMEFAAGLVVGILVAFVLGALGVFFLLRDRGPIAAANPPGPEVAPAVTVLMTEPFLTRQLREALADREQESQTETQPTSGGWIPLKIRMTEATLDLLPQARAEFQALVTVAAWGIPLSLRPVTEFSFVVRAGRVEILINHIQIRGFNVPRALVNSFVKRVLDAAQTKLNHSLMQLQRDTGVHLARIETTDDLLIVEFAAPPPQPLFTSVIESRNDSVSSA